MKYIVKTGTWALANLCRGKPLPLYEKNCLAIPVFMKIIVFYHKLKQNEILEDALWGLNYITGLINC
jgi:importin subunit alpha-1